MLRGARLSITLLAMVISCRAVLAAENEDQTTIAFSVAELDGKPRVRMAVGDLVLFMDRVVMLDSAKQRTGLSVQGNELELQEKGGTKNVDETAIRVWDKPAANPRVTKARFTVKSLDGSAHLRIVVGDTILYTKAAVVLRPNGMQVEIGFEGNDVQVKGRSREASVGALEVGISGDGFMLF